MSHHNATLDDAADFINGHAFKPEDWHGEGKPIIRIQNLTDANKPYNYTNKNVDSKYIIKTGDLLVSWSASLGVFVWQDERDALVNQHIFKVIPKHGVSQNFLRHALQEALMQMESHLHGATMKHVNRGEFLGTKIYLPPLEEQRRIAQILDTADAIRQKRQRSIELLDDFLRATFLDMFGDPVTNPKGWIIMKLGEMCSFQKDGVAADKIADGTQYIGLEHIQKNTGEILEIVSVKAGEIKSNKHVFDDSYILYGKLRPYLNKVALPAFSGICSTDIVPIKPVDDIANKAFVAQILKSKDFVSFADTKSSGANLPRISPKTLQSYLTICPPKAKQDEYRLVFENVEKLKGCANLSISVFDSLFASLSHLAFRGELTDGAAGQMIDAMKQAAAG